MAWEPDYVSTGELRDYVRIPTDDVEDSAQLALAIAGASRAIDRTCRRQFGFSSTAPRIYTPRFHPQLLKIVVDIDDLMDDPAGVTVASDVAGDGGFATPVPTFTLGPVNAAAEGKPWSYLVPTVPVPVVRESVRVTAQWGWPTVPSAVKQACLMQASRLLARRDSPYGVTGSPDTGGELRLLAKVDPDVAVLLRHYTRRWYAV